MARKRKSSRSRKRSSSRFNFSLDARQKAILVGVFIIFTTVVTVVSLISPNQGQLTHWVATMMWQLAGWGGLLLPLLTGALGLYLVLWGMGQPPPLPVYRLLGLGLLFLVLETLLSMAALARSESLTSYWAVAQEMTGGGYIGGFVAFALTTLVGTLGAVFALVVLGFLGAILLSGLTRTDISNAFRRITTRRQTPEPALEMGPERVIRVNPGRQSNGSDKGPVQLPLAPARDSDEKQEDDNKRKRRRGVKKQDEARPAASPAPAMKLNDGSRDEGIWTLPAMDEILEPSSEHDLDNAAIREQVEVIEHTLESFGAPATVVEINQGPTITQFGVEPNYIQMRSGRRTKVKVGKIASLADDLALALAARSIRIQAPVPGKGYIGIEVPNTAKALVSLRDVLESSDFRKIQSKSPLAIGLGQNVAGQSFAADLAAMPHLLIAGTTGSGKSVCVNGIIASLLLQNTPDNLKLVMVDPKRVELTGYNGIPHLAAPVVVEMDRVISTLQWALREMDRRYQRFAEVGARHVVDYNKKIRRRSDIEAMPYIVIIIDELADLMMLAPEDTERAVTRLAQMARATGIHMIIATQRPSVDVVTGLIKANFPARIAFAVASGTDSRVILDSTGAERLLGQGDMLFQSPDAASPLRLQGCFVSDKELDGLIGYWQRARRQNIITPDTNGRPQVPAVPPPSGEQPSTPQPDPASSTPSSTTPPPAATPTADATPQRESKPASKPKPPAATPSAPPLSTPAQQPLWEALQEEEEKADDVDELMPEAIALVRKLNKASTSLLQRRFRIGYTRAARMIDAMEQQGIIGPPTGTSKAREVLPPDGQVPAENSEDTDIEPEGDKPSEEGA